MDDESAESGDGDGGTADADTDSETSDPVVSFEDEGLETCVRAALGVSDEVLRASDVAALDHLECRDLEISDLGGLEHFSGLVDLSLAENRVTDVSPLAGLTELASLQLGDNLVTDVSPLSGLSGLVRLGLSENDIEDVTPLAALTGLEWLNLDANAIEDVSALADLTGLSWLTVERNHIADVSPLDALADAGCDVYAEIQNGSAKGGSAAGVRPELVHRQSAAPAARGSLELLGEASGRVALGYRTGGSLVPVRLEAEGALSLAGEEILLETGAGGRVAVGRATEDGLEMCRGAFAETCAFSMGVKAGEGRLGVAGDGLPIAAAQLVLAKPWRSPEGGALADEATPFDAIDEEVVPYALASPNQYDAGSCIFMATTGAMEILLNQHVPLEEIAYKGPTDLSERFLMNVTDTLPASVVPYFFTDLVYTYNHVGGSMTDADYPFIADYCVENADGSVSLSDASNPDAFLSCYANWFNDLPTDWESMLVETPAAERTSIFVDPLRNANSQWNVGLMDDDVVARIKHELRTRNAPVVVVYNHYLYWHAVMIVGYDDTQTGDSCPFVDDTLSYFGQQGAADYVQKIEDHMAELGESECHTTGKFYVRDSIYDGGSEEPTYTYSEDPLVQDKYSKRIIQHEYEWVKYLANHVVSIHRAD